MLYMEIIAVCSEIHTKHINTFAGLNTKFLNIKPGGTYSYHWALGDWNCCLPQYDSTSVERPATVFQTNLLPVASSSTYCL